MHETKYKFGVQITTICATPPSQTPPLVGISDDCDLFLRIPSENHALAAEFPCDWRLRGENREAIVIRDSQFWCAQILLQKALGVKGRWHPPQIFPGPRSYMTQTTLWIL